MKEKILIKNASVNNLQKVNVELPLYKLIVFTGVSGSGKSSLAFETIYIEGQRRYIESLSHSARRNLADFPKPEAEIEGMAPTIAIEQKTQGKSPRSTVGTLTGIYDFLRVLFAKVSTPFCPISKEPLKAQSREKILAYLQTNYSKLFPEKTKFLVLAPYVRGKKGEFKEDFLQLRQKGYTRIRVQKEILELTEDLVLSNKKALDIDLVIDRIIADPSHFTRVKEAVIQAMEVGKGMCSLLNLETQEEELFSEFGYSAISKTSYPPLTPQDFSFNHPKGMCETCKGLGIYFEFDLAKIIDPEKSIQEDCCSIASSFQTVRYGNIFTNLAHLYGFSVSTPWKKLSPKAKEVFLYGTEKKWTLMKFSHPHKRQKWTEYVRWKGVLWEAHERLKEAKSELYRKKMEELMHITPCPSCKQSRLKPYPSHAKIGGKTLFALTEMTLEELEVFIQNLKLPKEETIIAEELLKEILTRIQFLLKVGLSYLSLARTSATLSGGESQRVRLASQIGSGLVGAIYVLDEPSIGLHPQDHHQLIASLQSLKEKGNTVIVVEHDEDMMKAADEIVDFGPLAGKKGGEIIFQGGFSELLQAKNSLTAHYLTGTKKIHFSSPQNLSTKKLILKGASHHNLQKPTLKIPLGGLICVTGVSGSGKSSLIIDTLYPALSNELHHSKLPVGKYTSLEGVEHIDKIIAIDQSPIGRTPRSNAGTYLKIFDEIRDLFSSLPQSKVKGFKTGHFSFNVKEGSCPYCKGMGYVKVDMDFLEDAYVLCPQCKGKRFEPPVLEVFYKEKSIYDILQMDLESLLPFFEEIPSIRKKLEVLQKIGLGYLPLGQPSTTISGGEAQRIKLCKELIRPDSGNTLYVLDEPTTGLHFHDLHHLLQVLSELVQKGNTVLVIEHNLELIQTADWIIELGPKAGKQGGKIIAEGTPKTIARKNTPTGICLAEYFQKKPKSSAKPSTQSASSQIEIRKAKQNNLKEINVSLPRNEILVFTGPSGSGKTSLALDTIYAEGQRRYTDSLSAYARSFIKQCPKPLFESMEGLSPPIAIEAHKGGMNPRSTIGTLTESYDLLRILYAHLGEAYCPETGEKITSISKDTVLEKVRKLPQKTKIHILSPLPLKKETFSECLQRLKKEGFLRIRLNNQYYELEEAIPYDENQKQDLYLVIDRLVVQKGIEKRAYEAISQAAILGENTLLIAEEGKDHYFNLAFAVPSTGKSYPPITPKTFSFNAAEGMCLECQGLGISYGISSQNKGLYSKTISDIFYELSKDLENRFFIQFYTEYFHQKEIDIDTPLEELSEEKRKLFLKGDNTPFSQNGVHFTFIGLENLLEIAAKSALTALKEPLRYILEETPCLECQSSRLNPLARNVRLEGVTLPEFCAFSLEKALLFLEKISLKNKTFLEESLTLLKKHLYFLENLGLSYLSLDRSAPSLSGGELQRIRLAKQLGSGLSGCIYILDEPTTGLHPKDIEMLNQAIKRLKELKNTLILVEHDPLTIRLADRIYDFGPMAGNKGGYITAEGTLQEIEKNPNSLTGLYLSGQKKLPPIPPKRIPSQFFSVEKASLFNLKNLSVSFPLEAFTCLTGVSGSGKSTLLEKVIQEGVKKALDRGEDTSDLGYARLSGLKAFDKLVVLDQSPIGTTPRADVSTYTDLLTPLRKFFAELKSAKVKGLEPKHFSYHHKKGMCKTCWGMGYKWVSLQFLPPVKMECESCEGYRLNPLSLEVTYKMKHLGQVLYLTVDEAKDFFQEIKTMTRKLEFIQKVGLGYLTLGQEITSLSSGEAQRLRLSRELAKRSTGKTLYLMDEPTLGLHYEDMAKILPILQALVDKKNTLIVIEHNTDFLQYADYLIDLGPGAGDSGGKILAAGPFAEVLKNQASISAPYLKKK